MSREKALKVHYISQTYLLSNLTAYALGCIEDRMLTLAAWPWFDPPCLPIELILSLDQALSVHFTLKTCRNPVVRKGIIFQWEKRRGKGCVDGDKKPSISPREKRDFFSPLHLSNDKCPCQHFHTHVHWHKTWPLGYEGCFPQRKWKPFRGKSFADEWRTFSARVWLPSCRVSNVQVSLCSLIEPPFYVKINTSTIYWQYSWKVLNRLKSENA